MAARYHRLETAISSPLDNRSRAKVVAIDRHAAEYGDESPAAIATARSQLELPFPADSLYPDLEAGSPELMRSLKLLAGTGALIREARDLLEQKDPIGSDLAVQRLFGPVTELFNCRRLGDGFATLVNALLCALENLGGSALTLPQISAIGRIVEMIRSEPYLDFSIASERLGILEEVGLATTPRGFDYLAEWLDGKGVC